MTSHRRTRRARGFTLLELVVVLAVLAALAGLLIPRVDFVRRSADTATAASSMADTFSNLQLYRTTVSHYPGQFDSLLTSVSSSLPVDDTSASPPAKYTKLWVHATGDPFEVFKIPAYTGAPGSDQSWLSFLHLYGASPDGHIKFYDHNALATYATDSASVARNIEATSATGFWVAKVKAAGSPGAPQNAILDSLYPGGLPATDVPTLVVVGVGARCTAIGTTMSAAPVYTGVDPEANYCRFFAIFAIYPSGKRCELKGIVDSTYQVLNAQMKNYFTNQPD